MPLLRRRPEPQAEGGGAGLLVKAPLPQTQGPDRLALRLLRVPHPEELQVGITEEEPTAGGALAGMCIGLTLGEAEGYEVIDLRSPVGGTDEQMIEFDIHIRPHPTIGQRHLTAILPNDSV